MTHKQILRKAAPKILREILRSIPLLGIVFKIVYVIKDAMVDTEHHLA